MDRILGFPAKYVQGINAIDSVGDVAAKLGTSVFAFADAFVRGLVDSRIENSLATAQIPYKLETFGGECCRSEIDRLKQSAADASVIIAIGGGKALDTGKAVAAELERPFISIPTVASTDGPVSSIAVEYAEDHTHIGVMKFNCSPSAVLVDTQIIANAPARLLVAGMGDALATWFEARACQAKGKTNFRGGAISPIAMELSRLCYETILQFGVDALQAVGKGEVNEAVERIVEANVFLSGVGFENTGVAGAHALDTAVSRYCSDHSIQHGERVALGILFQLTLEEDAASERTLRHFYEQVGLPTNFAGIGLNSMTADEIDRLADIVLRDGSPIRNLPFDVSKDSIMHALSQLK